VGTNQSYPIVSLTALKAPFLTFDNFQLAFRRIVRGENSDYKQNYRHLLPTYNLALKHNIQDLINDLKTRAYRPTPPTIIFAPKASGVLRPLKILCLRDLIVYQAIVNIVAVRFEAEQEKYKFKRCFGAIFAGRQSHFFISLESDAIVNFLRTSKRRLRLETSMLRIST
jgi:hypothetical protein